MALKRQMGNLIDSINADMREALKDGLTTSEGGAIIGSFCESMLLTLPKDVRRTLWNAVVKGMERRFEAGRFDND